ncbi:unnamed protein product [Schistocephalus solidus]|uniref:Protein SEC13 homolog n=1 Tax=Schistocephalus solidus TaxID=70667 RepID=A0A183SHZ7_SCHSO|nr:unnamed protein product [Schistocephalus solidus]
MTLLAMFSHDAQLNYYGTVLATCSSDEVIKLFDVTNKKQVQIAELRGHRGPVWGLSWSHPMHGNLLASCSYDKTVIIWGQQEGKWHKVYEYTEHGSSVNCVCWAPHEYGLILASGSSDGSISVLTYTTTGNWEAKKILDAHSVGVNAVSWAPAINASFMLNPSLNQTVNSLVKRLASGGCDCLVKIWRYSEPHLRDDEAVICPTIDIADRLGYQHILSISPPDENIVEQIPAPRPRLYPRGLLPCRKAEEGVGQQETVFRTRAQKKEAVIVSATETVGTQHSAPGSVHRPFFPTAPDCMCFSVFREDQSSGRNWIEEARLEGHTDWVRDVAWSPSLSLSRQLIASCGQDCRVIIWQSQRDVNGQSASEQLGNTVEPAVWKLLPLQTYSDVVWHVSWSLTGNILAVSGGDNKVDFGGGGGGGGNYGEKLCTNPPECRFARRMASAFQWGRKPYEVVCPIVKPAVPRLTVIVILLVTPSVTTLSDFVGTVPGLRALYLRPYGGIGRPAAEEETLQTWR